MPVARSLYGLGLFVLVAILVAVVAVAISVRVRRGYGLTLMAVLAAAIYVVGIVLNNGLVAEPSLYLGPRSLAGLGTALTVAVELALYVISSAAVLIAVAIARRWGWLVGVVASVLPMVALALTGLLPTSPIKYAENVVPFTVALFCPLLVCVTYSTSRRRPSASPARAAR